MTAGWDGLAPGRIRLSPGALGPALRRRSSEALAAGALEPIATRCEVVAQDGIAFAVRVADGLGRKQRAGAGQARAGANPFLPYDERLFVADVTDTHVCLLNRFAVLEEHALIVTRAFEAQEAPLTAADFAALAACLAQLDGVGFYNAGAAAGASQRHKHLQLVPGPLGPGAERAPLEPALRAAALGEVPGRIPALRFPHAAARLDATRAADPVAAAGRALATYRALRDALGLTRPDRACNLLVTRAWMLLVPRVRAACEGIEVNALGFAGALLVRDRTQLERLRRLGPMRILERVAG